MPSYNHGYIQTNLAVALHKLQKYSIVTPSPDYQELPVADLLSDAVLD